LSQKRSRQAGAEKIALVKLDLFARGPISRPSEEHELDCSEIERYTRVAALFVTEAFGQRLISGVLGDISNDWETESPT
jgi:hypothetical protein